MPTIDRAEAARMLNVAIAEARQSLTEGGVPVGAVIVGESRTFQGGVDWLRERGVEVLYLESDDCRTMLQQFIQVHPDVWNEDIGEEEVR